MRKRRRIVIAGVAGLLAILFLTWLIGGMNVVRVKAATKAEIAAAVDPAVRYEWKELPDEQNAWPQLLVLFKLPTHSAANNFVPPLNERGQRQIKPFLDEWRWAEPRLDKILSLGKMQAPYRFLEQERTYNGQHPFGLPWTYVSQRLAYAQAAGQTADIWPALRRLIMYARLLINLEACPRLYEEQQNLWNWRPDSLRVGLSDPRLTAEQLRECVRLLPTSEDFIKSMQRGVKIDFGDSTVYPLQPERLGEFTKSYADKDDWRKYYAGELDVALSVRTISEIYKARLEALELPFSKAAAHYQAQRFKLLPKFPGLPWAQPKEGSLTKWWREFNYRLRMRMTPNAMIRFLGDSGYWFSFENFYLRMFWIEAARVFAGVQLYAKLYGHRPARLQQLVETRIFPALPVDPYSGGDLHYDGSKIWSVGADLVDDGGSAAPVASNHGPLDIVWDFAIHPWP